MDKILIFDNFLEKEELNTTKEIISSNDWKWGHESRHMFSYETPFWSMNLTDHHYFSVYLKEIIEKQVGKKFNLLRVYANGYTFGQDGIFHQDSDKSHHYTFCFYLTDMRDDYIDIAGGYLHFKLPEEKYNICYEPTFNRGIFFPSNYFHKATSFTRYIMDMRICIAWKLEEIL